MILLPDGSSFRKLAPVAGLCMVLAGCSGGEKALPVLPAEGDKEAASKTIDDPFGTQSGAQGSPAGAK